MTPTLREQILEAIQNNITLDWDTDGYSVEADEAAEAIEVICLENTLECFNRIVNAKGRSENLGLLDETFTIMERLKQLQTTNP